MSTEKHTFERALLSKIITGCGAVATVCIITLLFAESWKLGIAGVAGFSLIFGLAAKDVLVKYRKLDGEEDEP
ncbi:MAG: hypothetical protein JSS00_02985 [Proteobacteria bacterium]|nr:hypothetical protein [Pseudomonadota bacterium]